MRAKSEPVRTLLRALSVALALLAGRVPARAAMPPIWMLARSLPAPVAAPPDAAAAAWPQAAASPGLACRAAIDAAERQGGIPAHLMAAIGRVESGRRDERSGRIDPWPWSINAEGADHVYRTKAEAIAAVRALQAAGMRSIDVGCMQVSLLFHPEAFASLEDAFDPARNAAFAARFLGDLHAQTGSWATATAWYHSATPELGADYQRKVMAVLPDEQQAQPGLTSMGAPAARGAFMLSNHAGAARIIPMAAGVIGRGLAAYRAAPIPVASRVALR